MKNQNECGRVLPPDSRDAFSFTRGHGPAALLCSRVTQEPQDAPRLTEADLRALEAAFPNGEKDHVRMLVAEVREYRKSAHERAVQEVIAAAHVVRECRMSVKVNLDQYDRRALDRLNAAVDALRRIETP